MPPHTSCREGLMWITANKHKTWWRHWVASCREYRECWVRVELTGRVRSVQWPLVLTMLHMTNMTTRPWHTKSVQQTTTQSLAQWVFHQNYLSHRNVCTVCHIEGMTQGQIISGETITAKDANLYLESNQSWQDRNWSRIEDYSNMRSVCRLTCMTFYNESVLILREKSSSDTSGEVKMFSLQYGGDFRSDQSKY